MNTSRWFRLTLVAVLLLLAARWGQAVGEPSAPDAVAPTLGPWYVTGPLETKQFDEVLPPERRVDLEALSQGVSLWQRHDDWPDGQVHALPGSGRVATYLYRTITSPRSALVNASFGSDDGIAVWLNGQRIWTHDVPRGVGPDQDQVQLTLRPGENQLLMKIYNHGGGHGFYFQLGAAVRSLVLGRVAAERGIPLDPSGLRMAIGDMAASTPGMLSQTERWLAELDRWEAEFARLDEEVARGASNTESRQQAAVAQFVALQREALLSGPYLDFDSLLVVRRRANQLGLPQNWQGNCALAPRGYDNEIAVLSSFRTGGERATLFQPSQGAFVGDVDLRADATRILFSSIGANGRWQIFEMKVDGSGVRQVTPDDEPDVDSYDACYLPDGRIMFCSTRCFHGVPCVGGGNTVANLFRMNADGTQMRQLCFDQDHNWCPTVLNNGRVLYSRWEYSDTPHYFTRLLFHMNPDGTNQAEYYGSNSMWPNSIFYARPLPGHATKVIAVISGHHGVPRMGELVVFDPAHGRHEAEGAIQRIPGRGRTVAPTIRDTLVDGSWPKFLHPYPLSQKQFLVACQPGPQSLWGIYFVDTFDNMVLLAEEPDYALLEPVPLRKTESPPAVPDKVDMNRSDAVVYLADVYAGPGLADVPRGTVKRLRIYEPHYAYPGMGGHINIGIDGPWDGRRILGTVPVEADGSASFRVPANTPLAVQPLDADGRALQVMRSWFTAMPGEVLSCVGCHESQNSSPPSQPTLAAQRPPVEITPWYGPPRGFSFRREVQPVLDKYCVGCHDGQQTAGADMALDLRIDGSGRFRNFTPSYVALHPYVRRPGPESDYNRQMPREFHAGTSELIQRLEQGHHNVRLDAEAWDRLVTWIDLNVPDHGSWTEQTGGRHDVMQRRLAMRTKYAGRPEDPEAVIAGPPAVAPFVVPEPEVPRASHPPIAQWPFDAAPARHHRDSTGLATQLQLPLAPGVNLELVLVPAGEYILGDAGGNVDESPECHTIIARPFYLGRYEVTNAEYAVFRPSHDSGVISQTNKDQNERGIPVNGPRQPVVRVAWNDAAAFCDWLSRRTGRKCTLPTEVQWEWACRAGSAGPMFYGDSNADFGQLANLADVTLAQFARGDSPPWHPKDGRFSDGALVTAPVGSYAPNPWDLCDMIGNVAEWTRSSYRPYPYDPADGREAADMQEAKVVRGGSWYDRPKRARSATRRHYAPWQGVFDVGFRVAVEVP
ncbi:MAG: SUMF1/EgtB/PvdO family nonheme iron enzyme [Pirellulaceae bacterium]